MLILRFGVDFWMILVTCSSLDLVREAKIRCAGECCAIVVARVSPSDFGPTPVITTCEQVSMSVCHDHCQLTGLALDVFSKSLGDFCSRSELIPFHMRGHASQTHGLGSVSYTIEIYIRLWCLTFETAQTRSCDKGGPAIKVLSLNTRIAVPHP